MAAPSKRQTLPKNGSRGHLRSGSLLLSRLGQWSSRVFWSLENGLPGKLFCGGDETEARLDDSLAARGIRAAGLREKILTPYKVAAAAGASQSRLFALADRFRSAVLLTKVRFFGVTGLLFSLYAFVGFFLYQFFNFSYSRTSIRDLIVSAVIFAISLILLFIGKPVGEFLSGSRLFGRIFIGVLGIDPGSLRTAGEKAIPHGALAFVLGTGLGVAAIFLSPGRVLVWTLQFVLALVILAVPETGLLGAVLVLPFCPLSVTASFAAAAAVSFLIKLIRLKRIVRIRVPEILMALLILSAFLGSRGEAGKGDGSEVFLTYLLFGGLWFLIANTIKTGTLYRKLIACLMYGGMITLAMTGAGALLLAFRLGEWHALIPATTLSPDLLGPYIVVLVPLTLLHGRRWSGLAMLVLIALNAYFLSSMWVWFGIIVSVVAYCIFAHRAFFESLIAGGIALPMFVATFGDGLASFSVRMSGTASALMREYWLCGLGLGENVLLFGAAANGLAADGFAAHLYGRMILEGGLPQLLVFLLAAFASLQYVFTAIRNTQSGNAKILCGGVAAAAVMFLICGFAADPYADPRFFGLLFCLCPAASIAKDLYGRIAEES